MSGKQQFQLSFQVNPICLAGGLASMSNNVSGGLIPIANILLPGSFPNGLFGPGPTTDLDLFPAFRPLPGATLIENDMGNYPYLNIATAANAIITKPLPVSMLMVFPANTSGGYNSKYVSMDNLQQQLSVHCSAGGWFVVSTPSFIYPNCILKSLHDVTNQSSLQPQIMWQWDFIAPLLTQEQATATQNTLMSKITQGVPVNGDTSGSNVSTGSPNGGVSASTIPSAQNLQGTATTPQNTMATGQNVYGNSPSSPQAINSSSTISSQAQRTVQT